jgi:formate dehydrogenase accessory protein FdhD
MQQETLQPVSAFRHEGAAVEQVTESLAAEVPVAMQFNARPYAVMLATPADLGDFALGFSLTEGIIQEPSELTLLRPQWLEQGILLAMIIPAVREPNLMTRERNLSGRTGCGLCGTASLSAAIRPIRRVDKVRGGLGSQGLVAGMQQLARVQPINDASGAVHAAGVLTDDGALVVREDVGRHNAIDKAVGAVMGARRQPMALLVTSRASYEVVHKAAEVGCGVVAAISAPTALAVRLAREAGITLVGWTRPPRFTVYTGELS